MHAAQSPLYPDAAGDPSPGGSPAGTLVAAIRAGDRAMEAEFCRRYYPSVLRLLRGHTRDPARAEDIAHDALITVLVRLRNTGIDHPDRLTSFVHQTARFTFLGWLRHSDNQLQLVASMDDRARPEGDILDTVMQEEQRTRLAGLIARLDVERDREVLLRRYVCDETKPAICDALALTETHFDRVISRARKRLRRLAESAGDLLEPLAA